MLAKCLIDALGVSNAEKCIDNLRVIDAGKQEWALETHADSRATPTLEDLRPYISTYKPGGAEFPQCPSGGKYNFGRVMDLPTCSFPKRDLNLRDMEVHAVRNLQDYSGIGGATVSVLDDTGRWTRGTTGKDGWVRIRTWPRAPKAVEILSVGFQVYSNTGSYFRTNPTVALKILR